MLQVCVKLRLKKGRGDKLRLTSQQDVDVTQGNWSDFKCPRDKAPIDGCVCGIGPGVSTGGIPELHQRRLVDPHSFTWGTTAMGDKAFCSG